MAYGSKLVCVFCILLACSVPLWGQIEPIPSLPVQPLPLPGGDISPGYGLYNQFFPGFLNAPFYDSPNADPHGITNFRGVTAMGYTSGPATDNHGNKYVVITDIRVYQGEYIGGETAEPDPTKSAGATKSARSHGTFVEI